MSRYARETSFSSRASLSRSILEKHYDKIPVIVESRRNPYSISKVIASRSMTFGEFISMIISRVTIDETKSLIYFLNVKGRDNIIPVSKYMGDLYDTSRSNDGFLYVSWIEESTFG